MGDAPEWWLILKAARYLGVAPWDLLDQPRVWFALALEAESTDIAQHNAQVERQNRAQKRQRR